MSKTSLFVILLQKIKTTEDQVSKKRCLTVFISLITTFNNVDFQFKH